LNGTHKLLAYADVETKNTMGSTKDLLNLSSEFYIEANPEMIVCKLSRLQNTV